MIRFTQYDNFVVYRIGGSLFIDSEDVELVLTPDDDGGFRCSCQLTDFKHATRNFYVSALSRSFFDSEQAFVAAVLNAARVKLSDVPEKIRELLIAVLSMPPEEEVYSRILMEIEPAGSC